MVSVGNMMAELTCADDAEAVADAPAVDRATVAIPYGLPESTPGPDRAAKRHFAYTQKLRKTNLL